MENIATIHERIKLLIDKCGNGKNTVFASLIDNNEANVRGYVKGVMPKYDALEKIVTNLDINANWLLTGRGEMLRSEQVEQLQNPTIIYKSDPKDAEIIAAKDLIIKRDAELIAMLQCRIRSLEEIKTFRVQDLDIARSADTTTITGTKSIHK